MVMGFNTEIKYNGIVYHVQTEPRRDARIETLVYVKGAIIHSLKTSYQDLVNSPGFGEEKVSALLKDQHQQVIARIRAGEIGSPQAPPAAGLPAQ